MKIKNVIFTTCLITAMCFVGGLICVSAQESASSINDDTSSISKAIDEKKAQIEQINDQVKIYEQQIEEKQKQEVSLNNEMEILENRVAKTDLDIKAVEKSIELANIEIQLIDNEIKTTENKIFKKKQFLVEILQNIQTRDDELPLQLYFGTESLSELFDSLQQLESISKDLNNTLVELRSAKTKLGSQEITSLEKKSEAESLHSELKNKQNLLTEELGSKEMLATATKHSESEFQKLLRDIKEEQAFLNQQVLSLQTEVQNRLRSTEDSSVLHWPVNPYEKGISAYFHDPTYPFRHLFEHSGIDLPARTGTPVLSAATGYVAWARTGQLYGNYVMIIHSNGMATLYAHLSRIDVSPDQFVARGDQIGAVGSTGFSTGPHLHFEVRKEGIPTDPLNYLPSF